MVLPSPSNSLLNLSQLQNLFQLPLRHFFKQRTGKSSCGQWRNSPGINQYQLHLQYMGLCKIYMIDGMFIIVFF